jgi:hypothetical protein
MLKYRRPAVALSEQVASGEVRQSLWFAIGHNAKRGALSSGCRIPSAALRAGAPFRPVGCSPITTKCCLRPPDPLFFNGIEDMITRPHLADRAIMLTLSPIAERQRQPEHALWREFEFARLHSFRTLLDPVVDSSVIVTKLRLQSLLTTTPRVVKERTQASRPGVALSLRLACSELKPVVGFPVRLIRCCRTYGGACVQ